MPVDDAKRFPEGRRAMSLDGLDLAAGAAAPADVGGNA